MAVRNEIVVWFMTFKMESSVTKKSLIASFFSHSQENNGWFNETLHTVEMNADKQVAFVSYLNV